MTTLNEILKKYEINTNIPLKFGELDKFNITDVTDYRTELHDGNEVHVFTTPNIEDLVDEWILDLKNLQLSKIVKRNGKNTYVGYESYQYFEDGDVIVTSVY